MRSVGVCLPIVCSWNPGQEIADHKVGHRTAEPFADTLIRAEVLACVDPAEARLVLNGREALEGADDPGKHFRSDIQVKRFVAEERSEEHTSELQSHLNLVCR